jgi:beta-fructofuranosidase
MKSRAAFLHHTAKIFVFAILAVGWTALANRPEQNPAVVRAMENLLAKVSEAAADPTRPSYHFSAPACWMNDINGVLHHQGFFHIFYQLNPYGDQWGHIHWGHARSTDLVHWEHLPVALWPSGEKGEQHCFSGCLTLAGRHLPVIFYTSIGHPLPEQWAAIGSPDLLTWNKYDGNPVLKMDDHGGISIEEWRDPFVFSAEGKTYMVLGGRLPASQDRPAAVLLYQARREDLLKWTYKGVLFRHPNPNLHSIECPNFFPLGKRFVLLISPYGPVEYFVGTFDSSAAAFRTQQNGLADFSDNFYGTNVLQDARGRCILFGWLRGFQDTRSWNGCMALPRILTLNEQEELIQTPAPELKQLRGRLFEQQQITLDSRLSALEIQGGRLEIKMTMIPAGAAECGLIIRCRKDGTGGVPIAWQPNRLSAAGCQIPLPPDKPVEIHLFLDRSVIEIFLNGGRQCISRVLAPCPPENEDFVYLFAKEGPAHFKNIQIWQINPIDKQAGLPIP